MTERKVCLVLTPPEPRQAYLELYERMGKEFGFEVCFAVDLQDQVNNILQASFLIADLSGNDPGVLYNLGTAHTFGKRVFLVTEKLESVAFDLASNRTWVVKPSSENRQIFQAMEKFLGTRQTIGPVRLFLGKHAFFGENLIIRRFGAFVIDIFLLSVMLALLLFVFTLRDHSSLMATLGFLIDQVTTTGAAPESLGEIVLLSTLYLPFVYFVLSTWIFSATMGQVLMGIRVVQTDCRRVTFGQCMGRALLLYLLLSFSFLSALVGPGYRAVHDILSGTIVVRRDLL